MSFTSVYINNNCHSIKVHDRDELIYAVQNEIDRLGYDADLNHIDVSEITDFYGVFQHSKFIGDISKWDVSNGEVFSYMFHDSEFNSSLFRWDVSNGKYFTSMFGCSKFNQDISLWNVKNAISLKEMFIYSEFNQDIDMWDVSNVFDMEKMFAYSKFRQKPESWNPTNCICVDTFTTGFNHNMAPEWYTPIRYKYNSEISRMHKLESSANEYFGMTFEMLKQLEPGQYHVYLDRDTGEILGHDNKRTSCELLYTFKIKENISDNDLMSLLNKIKNTEKRKLECVYKTTLLQMYPLHFVNALLPWIVKQNPYHLNSKTPVQLYLLKSVNWHAEKAGFPKVKKEYSGKLCFC